MNSKHCQQAYTAGHLLVFVKRSGSLLRSSGTNPEQDSRTADRVELSGGKGIAVPGAGVAGRTRVGRGGMRPSPALVTPRQLGRGPQGRQVGLPTRCREALVPIESVHLSDRAKRLTKQHFGTFRAHSFASPGLSILLHFIPQPCIVFRHAWGGRVPLFLACAADLLFLRL